MTASRYQRWLKWFLQFNGVIMLLAVVAVFMPTSWIVWTHRWLDMGEFPAAPIAEYLARLTSALYTVMGVLVLLAATDVVKYSRFVTCLAIGMPAISISVTLTCLHLGMPLSWVVSDPVASSLYCIAILVLQRLARPGDARDSQGK